MIAIREKRKLAEQYPGEPRPPISTSCWAVTPICPTAAFLPASRASTSRSSIGRSTAPSRPTPRSTRSSSPGSTTASPISRCIRSISSPILNAVLGFLYVHLYPFDVSLAPDPTTSPPIQGTHGDTNYYFFETQDLPLFGPLRTLGVPESVIDVVEPFFRVLVELGYDRSIPPWEPTPARLIPTLDPVTVAGDLVTAIGEGIQQRPGPHRLATAAEHSRGAGRNHNSGRLRPDGNEAAEATDTDETTTRQQATEIDETTTGQQATDTDETTTGQQATETDETTTGQQVTDTDQTTTGQQVTDTDQTTTPTVSTSKPWKRAGRHETPRPLVRGPLGVYGQQIRGRQHSGDADAPTTQTAAAGDVATTAGTSSPESSSVGGSPGRRVA